jgi:NAD(P)-dependent dehydrogenase (short-subunit alcohol dehydrogenase family)
MAVEEIDAAGGVNGAPVELAVRDDGADQAVASSALDRPPRRPRGRRFRAAMGGGGTVGTIAEVEGRRDEPAVCVVTGAGRGIGRAVALALAEEGHSVCVNDTGVGLDGSGPSDGPAREVAAEIRDGGGSAMAASVDARTSPAARELVAGVEAWSGRTPTVLVHAAGTLRDAMAHKATDEDWAEVMASHLHVAVELTRAMAPGLRRERRGRIVYVGGAAGLVGSVGQAAYDVAKAGLFGLTRAIALEMAGRDVCVNYLAPFAFTRMTESIPPVTEQLRAYREFAPLARAGDVARVVVWLCSAAAAGISGQVFGVRGAEVALWSQPRPVVKAVSERGWDVSRLEEEARPRFEEHLTPLESEFDLFGEPPAVVTADVR